MEGRKGKVGRRKGRVRRKGRIGREEGEDWEGGKGGSAEEEEQGETSVCLLSLTPTSQDLKSSNMMEVSMALIIICKLIGSEMIPPLLPLVQDKLLHPK